MTIKSNDINAPDEEPGGEGKPWSFPRKIGILHSEVKREYFPTETQYITEKDAEHEAKVIASYLQNMGITTQLFLGRPESVADILAFAPDMIFNLVGSINGQESLSATIPGMLEALDIPYTGANMLGESLSYNKFLVKRLLQSHGIPTPVSQLFPSVNTPLNPELRFPLITKLNEIHGAVEVSINAISHNEKHLRERLKFLIDTYDQPVIAEEFIAGQEYTAIVLEGGNTKVYLAEKVFTKKDDPMQFATFEAQWEGSEDSYTYIKVNNHQTLIDQVKKAFLVLKMADYGKFDIRIDQAGRAFFIDSNSNPAFGPKELDVAMANILDLYDISFVEILKRIINNTMRDWYRREMTPSDSSQSKSNRV